MAARPRRLTNAFLALMLGLVLCELGLRVAGWMYLSSSDRTDNGSGHGPVLLCHGDSNVFGIYEAAEESYPARLQALFDRRAPAVGARVVNLGIPGLNSRQLAAALPHEIERHRPAAVLVTVGANNGWAWFESEELTYAGAALPEEPAWWEELRVLKLLELAIHRLSGEAHAEAAPRATPGPRQDAVRIEQDETAGERIFQVKNREGQDVQFRTPIDAEAAPADDFEASIRRDLAVMKRVCDERGVELLLVGYGADRGSYGGANRAMRQAAAEHGIAHADPCHQVAELSDTLGFDDVFHLDLHPRGPGYEVIARAAYEHLVDVLGIDAPHVPDVLRGIGRRSHGTVGIRFTGRLDAAPGSPDAATLEFFDGPAERPFTACLWGLRPAGTPFAARPVDDLLVDDALFRSTSQSNLLTGTFDAAGNARIPLAPLLGGNPAALARLTDHLLEAAYMIHPKGDRTLVSQISETATLTLR
jgi:lysophospholipase L1-like esterase